MHLNPVGTLIDDSSVDHLNIQNIGVNSHAAIDVHIADGTLHFTEASISHLNIGDIGVNSHAAIDTHIADATIHFTVGSIDHGLLLGLADDDHTQYILDGIGRATPQSLIGGLAAGDILDITGSSSSPDVGIVQINSPITFAYDTVSNTTPAQPFLMQWGPTVTASAPYIGGCLQTEAVFNITTGTFIPAIFSDTNRYNQGATPGFSAVTFINELSVIANLGNFNLMSALVMNIGLTHERNTSGTSTTPGTTGVSFAAQTRATVSGAVMTKTGMTGLAMRPTFSTVAGSTVNLGLIRGLHCFNPAVALFQPGAGVETMAGYIGVDVNAIPFGGNVLKVALRSALTAATFTRFIQNLSTAASEFGSGIVHINDNTPIQFGGALNAADVSLFWNSAGYLETFFWSTSDFLQTSSPAADRFLFDANGTDHEFNFNCNRFSLGAQTGAVGNQIGAFVAPAVTVTIGGDFTQFLMTSGGNIIADAALGTVAGWVVNAPSITLGTGSVTTGVALNVGGNPNQGTNRVGVRIISNPTGGGGVNAALWVTAGRAQFDGFVDINQPIALGGGAAATLGTIGGAGPTAAAQQQWVEMEVNGVRHWFAVWI